MRLWTALLAAASVVVACGKSDPSAEETAGTAGSGGVGSGLGTGGATAAAGGTAGSAVGQAGVEEPGAGGTASPAGGQAGELGTAGDPGAGGDPGPSGRGGTGGGVSGAGGLHGVTLFSSDFSFGDGSPFEGTKATSCGLLTLTSSNTEPYDSTSFRDVLDNADAASVSLAFDASISDLVLRIRRVFPAESIRGFNVAPDSVTGGLTLNEGVVSTTRDDDYGSGELVWSALDTATIEFAIDAPEGAIALDGFTVACNP